MISVAMVEEGAALLVEVGTYIAQQIAAAKAGTDAEAELALARVQSLRAAVAGARGVEVADHDAAVRGE